MLVCLAILASCQSSHPAQSGGASISRLPGQYQFTEGPVWSSDGYLLFTDIPASRIYKWDGKSMTVYREGTNSANGLTIGLDGTLYACGHGSRSVSATVKGGVRQTLVAEYEGKRLNSPNDVTIQKSTGVLVFSDPTYGLGSAASETGGQGVYAYDPSTKKTTRLLLASSQPNGVAFSRDDKWLYVADSGSGKLSKFAFRVTGLGKPEWTVDAPFADGIRVAADGRIWAACNDGVRTYLPNGDLVQTTVFPEQPSNLAFDKDEKALYVTARTGVYRLMLPAPADLGQGR